MNPRIAKGMTQPLQLEGLTALAELDHKAEGHSNDEEFSDEEEAENASVGAIPTDIGPQLERAVSDAVTMENVIIARLPHYAKAADVHRHDTTLYHAKLMSGMASKHDFPYGPHNLATYRAPPVTAIMADQIGLHYGHALFEEKHLIHVDHVQMEINRLDALMDVILREKKALETNIDNLRKKEKERQESIKTLREMWKSNLQAIDEHRRLSGTPSETIQNEAKKGFSAEDLKTLGIESSSYQC